VLRCCCAAQGAVHAVIMQNRLRHLEEAVHNGTVGARETFLSDPANIVRMTDAARCAQTQSGPPYRSFRSCIPAFRASALFAVPSAVPAVADSACMHAWQSCLALSLPAPWPS
jgi:hypothetical protein